MFPVLEYYVQVSAAFQQLFLLPFCVLLRGYALLQQSAHALPDGFSQVPAGASVLPQLSGALLRASEFLLSGTRKPQ